MKKEVLKYINFLKDRGISNPVLEVQRFISEKFNIPLHKVIAGDFDFSEKLEESLKDFCEKRVKGFPYGYILGFTYFRGRRFYVNSDVLIPRPETETIVEFVLKKVGKGFKGTLLDCCTGSGNLGITLAKELPFAKVFASDIYLNALKVAWKNAENLSADLSFVQCDKLCCFKEKSFDVIVANPPYVGIKEKNTLEKEVLNEPEIALFGGEEGYEFFKDFLFQALKVVKEKGLIVFEMGYNQSESIKTVANELLKGQNLYFIKDLNGHLRVGVLENA